MRDRPTPFYVFDTVDERNQAFELAVKNFKELGLTEPPSFTPEAPPRFLYVRGDIDRSSKTSPDGKTRLELHGNSARLIDVATGRQIGKDLDAGQWNEGQDRQFKFTCCSFSPDGKVIHYEADDFSLDIS